MPKTKISEYSTTNTDNSDIESINIAEGCAPSGINNAIRELMVHLKEFQTGASGDPLTVAGTFVASGGATLSGTNTFSGSTVMAASAGTSASPSIYFSGDTNTGVFSPAADTIAAATGGTERLRITSAGNVGIGTTTPSAYGAGYVTVGANGSTMSGFETFANGTLVGYMQGYSTLMYVGSKTAIPLVLLTNDTERMRIDSSGNVGIGTTSPSYKLDVDRASVGIVARFKGGTRSAHIYSDNDAVYFTSDTGVATAFGCNEASDFLTFYTGNSERMRIDSSGKVGIGTSAPDYSLQILKNQAATTSISVDNNTGNAAAHASLILHTGGVSSGDPFVYFRNEVTDWSIGCDNSDSDKFKISKSSTLGTNDYFNIDSSGNVGIGTTTPLTKFDVKYEGVSASGGVYLVRNNTINLRADVTGTTSAQIGTETSHPFLFVTNGSERARITSGGEVYIAGTTDQGAYNLQCNGTGVWGAGAYVNGSDARIKEDVAPIDSGLDVVEKLNPVTYRYKEDWSKDQSVQTGFIAQELLVALDGKNYVDGIVQQGGAEGYYSVAYQNIIPILTKAIQELSAKNAALEARIAALES